MKTLLVALDSSSRAQPVLSAAIEHAQATRAKLLLFRVVGIPSDFHPSAMAMSPEEVLHLLEQRATAELCAFANTVPADVPCQTNVEVGTAWQGICQAALKFDASLIIIGSHGYGGLDRVLGTTASRVVNHADRSVLVVRSKGPVDPSA